MQIDTVVRSYTRFNLLDGPLCTVATRAGAVTVTCGFAEWVCANSDN